MGCLEDIKYVKEAALSQLKMHICDESCSEQALGEVADIVKDMCESEYYCTVTKAMEESVNDPYAGVYGYSNPRMKMPDMRGYRPFVDQQPYINEYLGIEDRMGYNPTASSTHSDMNQYGKAFREYERSRKHYTATKDESDKMEMQKHMNEHIRDIITTVRQMWKESDQEQKMHLKHDMQSLLEDMKE